MDKNNEFIYNRNDVVLNWPFNDCVLEFDSTSSDENRKEIF
jgi:hypothetical protein